MQDGAVFGDVDPASRKHRCNPPFEAGFLSELEQELERLIGNPILRVIEVNAHGRGSETFATTRVIREQLAQMQLLNLLIVRFEGFPRVASHSGPSFDRFHFRYSFSFMD